MPTTTDKQAIYNGIDFCFDKSSAFIPGSYILFREEYAKEFGKVTKVWTVIEGASPYGPSLGVVKWFGRWRKYSFFPEAGKVFEETCMREIAYFCETATRFHRVALKEKKKTVAA